MAADYCGLALASSDFSTVAVLILAAMGLTGVILILAHVVGPKRKGPIKDDTYESGMTPVSDTRRRFNVRFFLVAVMYLIFGVEVVFLYPWAVVFPKLRQGLSEHQAAAAVEALESQSSLAEQAAALAEAGYTPGFTFGAMLIFFLLLVVGFVYEWRKGIFRWD